MPLLFSYGTLQEPGTQMSTFGRLLAGRRDDLPGYERVGIVLDDHTFVALSGRAQHSNAAFTGSGESKVPGIVLEVTDAELAKADEYEKLANYQRMVVTLASGKRA